MYIRMLFVCILDTIVLCVCMGVYEGTRFQDIYIFNLLTNLTLYICIYICIYYIYMYIYIYIQAIDICFVSSMRFVSR